MSNNLNLNKNNNEVVMGEQQLQETVEGIIEETAAGKKPFKGIKRNVNRVMNSLDSGNLERIKRKIMHRLYENAEGNNCFCVVKRIDVIGYDHNDYIESYQVVGMSPILFAFGELDNINRLLKVRKEDDNSNSKPKNEPVGPTQEYKLYNNIVIVSFKNNEALYDDARREGMTINKESYFPVSASNSMAKSSKVFFTNHDYRHQFKIMDDLTGNILSDYLANNGIEVSSYDDIAKVAGRVCLCATTPSLWPEAGKTRNVFYFNGSIDSLDEESRLEDMIDNHFRDGFGIFSDGIASDMFTELAKEEVSMAQARRISTQARVRGAAGKGNWRAYNAAQRYKEIYWLRKIDITKCHCWIDGEKIDLVNISDEDLKTIAAKVDIIGDKDVFKLFNFDKLDKGEYLEIGIVSLPNVTEGHMGSQIAFKLNEDVAEGMEYFKALTERQLASGVNVGRIGFEKDSMKLANTAYYNCMALNPEVAETDKLLNNYKISQIDTANINKVANLKFDVKSLYSRMVPEDHLLNDMKEVLGSRMINYTMPDGTVERVRCLECYSSEFEKQYKQLKKDLAANTEMTDKEKAVILVNARVAVGIKSPSQGGKEFEMFYFVLKDEISSRGVTMEYFLFIKECPDACIVLPQDNTMKHLLAGSDFDGDDMSHFFAEFSEIDGKIVTGLLYDGKIINDYTSMVVRRRVRDKNIGYAALIVYHEDKPASFAKEETKKEEENALEKMDIMSIF